MPTNIWRILRTPPAEGAWNMALDEAILLSAGSGKALPTLRLFAWHPACLSLGYAQSVQDVNLTAINALGWGLVRRSTGGRAILHVDELTYSVITPVDNAVMSGGLTESYRRISAAILEALHRLGIDANADREYQTPPGTDKKGAVCFEVPSNYEITFQEKKLVGSAQARRKEGILQHGTLPLFGDLARILQVLNMPINADLDTTRQKLYQRAATVETILQKTIPWETAAEAFEAAFASTLDIDFVQGEISPWEAAQTERLIDDKFGNDAWTHRI